MINTLVAAINSVLWDTVLIYMLLAAGLWFSYKLGLVQFRLFRHMFSIMRHSTKSSTSGISSFQALCTSLAARVGTGNLAGVAVAISLGGPGAVFWMWLIALLGMATGFAESTLGQAYKVRDKGGEFRGGPAYYIQMGLKKRWLAVIFSIFLFMGYGFIFSAVQANSITDAMNNAYGVDPFVSGLVIVFLAALIVIGSVRSIARFAEIVVPFMALAYVVLALYIMLSNITLVPGILYEIVSSALGFSEAAGGVFGAAMANGIKRGLYSNEAGSGSAPHAAACAQPNPPHPVSQGLVQMLGVFVDTIIICTATAVVILLAGGSSGEQMEGVRLTQASMVEHVGPWGMDFVAIAITLFAFTSVVANYAYGENNLHMFKLDNKWGRITFTSGYLAMILWGSQAQLPHVWAAADMALGLMTFINIIAIVWMTKTIAALLKDYTSQRDAGQVPSFDPENVKDIQGDLEPGVWPHK